MAEWGSEVVWPSGGMSCEPSGECEVVWPSGE